MEILQSQILDHIHLILGVGGSVFAVFQAMFFRTPIGFPVKPSHDFVLKSLSRRKNGLIVIALIYYISTAIAVVVIIEKMAQGNESIWAWPGYFLLGIVGMTMITLWVSQIIVPIETRYVRAFLNSTSYTEDDYVQLINTLENTEHDYNIDMDVLYDAIGLDKET